MKLYFCKNGRSPKLANSLSVVQCDSVEDVEVLDSDFDHDIKYTQDCMLVAENAQSNLKPRPTSPLHEMRALVRLNCATVACHHPPASLGHRCGRAQCHGCVSISSSVVKGNQLGTASLVVTIYVREYMPFPLRRTPPSPSRQRAKKKGGASIPPPPYPSPPPTPSISNRRRRPSISFGTRPSLQRSA